MVDKFPESRAETSVRSGLPLLDWLPGVFMLFFFAGGLYLTFTNPAIRELPEDEPFLTGEWTAAYETAFDEGLAIRPFAIDSWSALSYRLFNEGRSGVLVGANSWLFTSEEFVHYPGEAAELEEKLAFINSVRNTLMDQGIILVVAAIPSKARVYEDELGRNRLPEHARTRYERLIEGLNERGIIAPDLLTPLLAAREVAPVFLRTDTHWTPFGAGVAADALAESILAVFGLETLSDDTFERSFLETEPFEGDLLNFLPLGRYAHLGPAPETIERLETVQTNETSLGLFDDVHIPVTLIGTSFSANPTWDFDGALRAALGADVLNLSEEGRGPFVPMIDYLENQIYLETTPDFIIWEIPVRYVPIPYDLDMNELTGSASLYGLY